MEDFDWADRNLNAGSPHYLQDRGVQVYFAPNIPDNVKVVNLGRGSVTSFHPGEERPQTGYYADYDSLRRWTEAQGIPFVETEGLVSVD